MIKNRSDGGYVFMDTIIALIIISLTLTSVYDLLINTFKSQDSIIQKAELILDKSEEYEKSFKTTIQG